MKPALLLLLLPCIASAEVACAPFEDSALTKGQVISWSLSDSAGPFLIWQCWQNKDATWKITTRHCIEAPWSSLGATPLTRLGNRAETIRKAADPVQQFKNSYARFVTKASPRCAAMLKAGSTN